MLVTATPLKERILNSVAIDSNGCWIWQKRTNNAGYGQICVGSRTDGTRRTAVAHRVSYEAYVGPIKPELQIDHLCKVRACVNPKHLEQVTAKENIHRSDALWKQEARRTHCPQGHEYTEDNIYRGVKNERNCKTCMKARSRARYWSSKKLSLEGGLTLSPAR